MIHPVFKRWFDITVTDETEYSMRTDRDELRCMTHDLEDELQPRKLCDVLSDLAAQRATAARRERAGKSPETRRRMLRERWTRVLGPIQPSGASHARISRRDRENIGEISVERIVLQTEPDIIVPTLLLLPDRSSDRRPPVVVAVAQGGKAGFLQHRRGPIAGLLAGGVAVCLPDLRGLGETAPDGSRGPWGSMTAHSSTELMLGGTIVGAQLRDLRSVLRYLRTREDLDTQKVGLWGDSFVPTNPPETDFRVPRRVDGRARQPEPIGGLLALLGALFEDEVCAVCGRGGLSDFHSVLASQFVYIPHDVVIPGVLCIGDLCDVAAALAPRPLRLDELVDGYNRRRANATLQDLYRPAVESYRAMHASGNFSFGKPEADPAQWLLEQVQVR
jgi:hypothetical protein